MTGRDPPRARRAAKTIHEGHEEALRVLAPLGVLSGSVYKPLPFQLAVTAEIDQDARRVAGCFEIVEKLGLLSPRQTVKRLDLNDNLLKANQVSKIFFSQGYAFILNGE